MLTAGSYTRISPQWGGAGADLVLGPNTSNAVSITTGDRKLKISLTYRLVDVS
jgi:type V secretory pathway adhesin AidA